MTEIPMTEAQSIAWNLMVEHERRFLHLIARDLGLEGKPWEFIPLKRAFAIADPVAGMKKIVEERDADTHS